MSLSVPSAAMEGQRGVLDHMVKQNPYICFFFFCIMQKPAVWEIHPEIMFNHQTAPHCSSAMTGCSLDGLCKVHGWNNKRCMQAHRGGIPSGKTDTVLCSLVPLTLNLFYDSFDLDVPQSGCQENTSFFWKSSQLKLCYLSFAYIS